MSGKLKAAAVVYETSLEQEARREREAKSDGLLAEVERVQERGGYWDDTRAMLGWYYAMETRMETAPAIDYSQERVQGLQVDRDQRIHQKAYVEMALRELERVQGDDRGRILLWLHFRVPKPIQGAAGLYVDKDGIKRTKHSAPGVAIRELHEHYHGASKHQTVRDFWRAFRIVERYAMDKGWVRYRHQRKGEEQQAQVYQRDRSEG